MTAYLTMVRGLFQVENIFLKKTELRFSAADIEVPHMAGQTDENDELNGK
jgi:hypothetical protein